MPKWSGIAGSIDVGDATLDTRRGAVLEDGLVKHPLTGTVHSDDYRHCLECEAAKRADNMRMLRDAAAGRPDAQTEDLLAALAERNIHSRADLEVAELGYMPCSVCAARNESCPHQTLWIVEVGQKWEDADEVTVWSRRDLADAHATKWRHLGWARVTEAKLNQEA